MSWFYTFEGWSLAQTLGFGFMGSWVTSTSCSALADSCPLFPLSRVLTWYSSSPPYWHFLQKQTKCNMIRPCAYCNISFARACMKIVDMLQKRLRSNTSTWIPTLIVRVNNLVSSMIDHGWPICTTPHDKYMSVQLCLTSCVACLTRWRGSASHTLMAPLIFFLRAFAGKSHRKTNWENIVKKCAISTIHPCQWRLFQIWRGACVEQLVWFVFMH